MIFKVLTLFPEMIESVMHTGIIGRAVKERALKLETFNIRDHADNPRAQIDDYPYGGGAGQVIQAEPVFQCFKTACGHDPVSSDHKRRVIYLSPQGRRFNQRMAKEFSKDDELVFICGHYEGVDERVLDEIVTDYVSAGDYILTGGELPALMVMDAVARLLPGVLGNDDSPEIETFYRDLLEYPQYSRPEVWHDVKVPEVLLTGNHADIEKWRLDRSVERTKRNRPDLFDIYEDKKEMIERLKKTGVSSIPASQALLFDDTDILFRSDSSVLVIDYDLERFFFCSLEKGKSEPCEEDLRRVQDLIFIFNKTAPVCVVCGFDPGPDQESMHYTMIAFTEKTPLSTKRVSNYGKYGKYLQEEVSKAHDAGRIFYEFLSPDDPAIEDALNMGFYKAEIVQFSTCNY